MIKFDLGLPPEPVPGKEVMPRLEKSGAFCAMRNGNALYIFSIASHDIYRFAVPESTLPDAIIFTEGKHAVHVIDCYKNKKDLLIDYSIPQVDYSDMIPDLQSLEPLGSAPLYAIKAVMHAAAIEKIKPAYNGVCLFVSAERTGTAATDSRRLSFYQCDLQGLPESVILPLDFVRMIQDNVAIFRHGENVIARAGNVSTKLSDAQFPDINMVIPADVSEYTKYIRNIDVDKLSEYRSILAGQNTSVSFHGGGIIKFRGEGKQINLVLNYETNLEQPIAVNLGMLMDALNVSGEMKFKGGMNPIIFQNSKQLELIMPIQIAEKKQEEETE